MKTNLTRSILRSTSFAVYLAMLANCTISIAAGSPLKVAGNLVVDLHANDLAYTSGQAVTDWRNDGSALVGDFTGAGANAPVFAENVLGSNAAFFDLTDFVASIGNVPTSVQGNNSWSLETWILNPEIRLGVEEIYFQWGRRNGNTGTAATAHYADQGDGNRSQFAAVSHFGGTGMGWGVDGVPDSSKTPVANQWHHFVITFDGGTERIYVDGNSTPVNAEAKTLHINEGYAPLRFSLGGVLYDNPTGGGTAVATQIGSGIPLGFSGYVAALRMHTGVLSGPDVANNFSAGIAAQPVPEPSTLAMAVGLFLAATLRHRTASVKAPEFV